MPETAGGASKEDSHDEFAGAIVRGEPSAGEGDPALFRGEGRDEAGLRDLAGHVEKVARHADESVHPETDRRGVADDL